VFWERHLNKCDFIISYFILFKISNIRPGCYNHIVEKNYNESVDQNIQHDFHFVHLSRKIGSKKQESVGGIGE